MLTEDASAPLPGFRIQGVEPEVGSSVLMKGITDESPETPARR